MPKKSGKINSKKTLPQKRNNKRPEESYLALLNILEDIEVEREIINKERDRALAIINNLSDGILVFDKKKNLSLINPQAELFFETKAPDIIGKSASDFAEIPLFKSLINLLSQEDKKIFRKELSLKKNLILEATVTPLIIEKEEMGTLINLHDITKEKTVERIKTEFVSLSAHQLRTPLSAIKWTLRMLLDGDAGELNKEQRDFLEKTYKSNERMISLINDLLNVTRIEEGRYIYQPLFRDFVGIAHSVVDLYRGEIEKKNIKFEFKEPEQKLPRILADEEKIKLAVENLLNNAIGYTFPGGSIIISIDLLENEIEFKIEDTGTGIPKDEQSRVFTKFFRGINAVRMETEGSGLGLFVTKNIIEAHGGRIWFKSEEGRGSTFYFTLPLTKPKIE